MKYENDNFIIYYSENDNNINLIIEVLDNRAKEIFDYFDVEKLNEKIIVKIYYSIDDFKKYLVPYLKLDGYEYKDWMCASTHDGNINLLDMESCRKTKEHKDMNIDYFLTVVIHELVHKCNMIVKGGMIDDTVWFYEALATNLCGDSFSLKYIEEDLITLSKNFSNIEYNYNKAFTIGQYILNKYTRENILEFCKDESLLDKVSVTDINRYVKGITFDFNDSNKLLEYMNEFEYKWMDKNGSINDEIVPSMYENYSFMTPKEVVINNCGICVDQSNYALVALSKMGYNPESYTIQIFREDTAPGHAFIVYEDNNKFYWFENAWGANKGIHEYETKEKLFEDITNKLFILENANLEEQKTLIIEKTIQYPYHSSYEEMDKIKELNKLIKYNNHYFHGSPKLLSSLETRQAHDDNNDKINSANALFLTDSFLMASAYAFKDTIKEENINSKFNITLANQLPFMTMENVLVDNELEGYIYVFDKNDEVINEPIGSNQFKSYKSLNPIDVIKIRYEDFKFLYDIKVNEIRKGVKL